MRHAVLVALVVAVPAAAQPITPEQLAKIKAATVYVGVESADRKGSGSGFLVRVDGETGYVVTNAHVIDPHFEKKELGLSVPPGTEKPTIRVSFDRGSPTERTVPATVVASTIEPDLAVLKLTGVKNLPAPFDLTKPPKVMELLPVLVCGFPFGQKNIDIGQASVSSLVTNDAGQLMEIQLTGALNPGNSGGPILTTDGNLVGVAVKTIVGAGKGLAVPGDRVRAILVGGVGGRVRLIPKQVGGGGAIPTRLEVDVADPFGKIKGVVAHVGPPRGQMPAQPGLLPGLSKYPLTIADGKGRADITLPAGSAGAIVQFEVDHADGKSVSNALAVPLVVSPAVLMGDGGLSLKLDDGRTVPFPNPRRPAEEDTDPDPLSQLNRNPADSVGKTVTVDCRTRCVVGEKGDGFELDIENAAGNQPSNLLVRVPKDLALQLADLDLNGTPLTDVWAFAVRLTGTVKKINKESRHVLDVSEIGFLAGGKPKSTLKPETTAPSGPPTLATLNRFPQEYAGKSITVEGRVRGVRGAGKNYGLDVMFPNGSVPLNLEFYTSRELYTVVQDDLPRDSVRSHARLTLQVERVDAKTGHGVVGVSQVELLTADGDAGKKLASAAKISYPAATVVPAPFSRAAESSERSAAPPKTDSVAKPVATKGGTNWMTVALAVAATVGVFVAAGVGFLLLRKRAMATPVKSKYANKPTADGGAAFPGFDHPDDAAEPR